MISIEVDRLNRFSGCRVEFNQVAILLRHVLAARDDPQMLGGTVKSHRVRAFGQIVGALDLQRRCIKHGRGLVAVYDQELVGIGRVVNTVRNAKTFHPLEDLAILKIEHLELSAFLASKEHSTVSRVDREVVEVTGIAGQVDRTRELEGH